MPESGEVQVTKSTGYCGWSTALEKKKESQNLKGGNQEIKLPITHFQIKTTKLSPGTMAIFRSKSGKQVEYEDQSERDYKMHTANVHDPILTAVNEAQPFEQAAERNIGRKPSYLSQDSSDLKDIFGHSITQSDMSNPTRSRNERPLDTIRAFEYAITGDMTYKDLLETNRLGWGFHEDFSHYNLVPGQHGQQDQQEYSRPTANFDSQPMYNAQNYSASSLKKNEPKKKKGLFGRKKK